MGIYASYYDLFEVERPVFSLGVGEVAYADARAAVSGTDSCGTLATQIAT